MADVAVRGAMPTKKAPSPVIEAAREASITVVLVFLLSIYMVGFKTEAAQGQPLSFVTQFSDVIWACILVPVGRFLIALNRLGRSQPALIGGALGFFYLSVLGATGMFEPAENPT